MYLTEQERIADYQRGWNDAMKSREPALGHSIMYQIGYLEARKGGTRRFTVEIETETCH